MKQFVQDPKIKGHNFIMKTQTKDSGNDFSILTSLFKDKACYPPEMDSDENPKAGPDINTFNPEKTAVDYNAPDQAIGFINYLQGLANEYREKNIYVLMGCDYTYENAGQNYKKMETIMKYIQDNYKKEANMNLFFSTPSEYIKAIKAEKATYPVYENDLLPYSEGNNEVWSGFFSSRPGLKKTIKDTSAIFHAHNKIFAQ